MATADENPYRVTRVEALPYRALDFSWDAFLGRLKASGYRGAVVGPHGSGKTTLLLEAQRRLEARGIAVTYGFLNEQTIGKRRAAIGLLREAASDTVLFLDGAEQLDPLTWAWFKRRARRLRGLVVTTHRPGRLPTLYQTRSSEGALRDLLESLNPGEVDADWERALAHYRACRGNVRDVFFALYDDHARAGATLGVSASPERR